MLHIYLLRHGKTEYNAQSRYQGKTDVPLSAQGAAELTRADFSPEVVFVSPLSRARETARRLFPKGRQIPVEDFAEMDFGDFEGRTAAEMAEDEDYVSWVHDGCRGRCPGGESLREFQDRCCEAFDALLSAGQEETLVIVSHGGVVMALMERFALPEKEWFTWYAPNGGGFHLTLDDELWRTKRKLCLAEPVCYGSGN